MRRRTVGRGVRPCLLSDPRLREEERRSGLPVRLAVAALVGEASRSGRFVWQPRVLVERLLPGEGVDGVALFRALLRAGVVRRYRVSGVPFGEVAEWVWGQVLHVGRPDGTPDLPAPPWASCDESAGSLVGSAPRFQRRAVTRTKVSTPGPNDYGDFPNSAFFSRADRAEVSTSEPNDSAGFSASTVAEPAEVAEVSTSEPNNGAAFSGSGGSTPVVGAAEVAKVSTPGPNDPGAFSVSAPPNSPSRGGNIRGGNVLLLFPEETPAVSNPRRSNRVVSNPENARARETWLTPFADAYREVFGATPAMGLLAKSVGGVVDDLAGDREEALRRFRRWLAEQDPRFVSLPRFRQTHGASRYASDEPPRLLSHNGQVAARVYERMRAMGLVSG